MRFDPLRTAWDPLRDAWVLLRGEEDRLALPPPSTLAVVARHNDSAQTMTQNERILREMVMTRPFPQDTGTGPDCLHIVNYFLLLNDSG